MSYIEYNGKYLTKGNCIVFICDGVGSIGYNIYKKENFIGSTTLKIGRNEKLNKYIGLFMTTIMDKNRQLYNFGYKRNEQRLRNEKVYLPINSKMQPDYEFMEAYMREKEEKIKKQYKKIVLKRLKTKFKKPIYPQKWKEFEISQIFNKIQRGKRHISSNRKLGNIPYYSASIDNNGLTDFISNPLFLIKENSIIYSTFGDAYFAGINYTASDEINIFSYPELNKYNALFIVQALRQNHSKYSFARKAFYNKIFRDKILLPVTEQNQPDYEFMEAYMKYLEQKKLRAYLDYLEK